jgi:hypothetical protein
MTTSRKTMFLDLLQLNALRFYSSSNTVVPSSLVLTAKGNGETYFTSISSIVGSFFQNVAVPGQVTIQASSNLTLNISSQTNELFLSTNSSTLFIGVPVVSTLTSTINAVLASTMYSILNYPNIVSSVTYTGITGRQNVSTLATDNVLSNSGNAVFSTFQTNFSNMSSFINPNGSTRMYVEYYPSIIFGPVVTPSSISSFTLYPEGNSSIKSVVSLSSHFMYVNSTGSNVPVNKSGIQQYIPVTSSYPYSVSSFLNSRVLSNSFVTPMRLEFDTTVINSNVSIVHYISDGMGSIKTVGGNDVFRTGLETSTFIINTSVNDRNILFVNINNSGNAF